MQQVKSNPEIMFFFCFYLLPLFILGDELIIHESANQTCYIFWQIHNICGNEFPNIWIGQDLLSENLVEYASTKESAGLMS